MRGSDGKAARRKGAGDMKVVRVIFISIIFAMLLFASYSIVVLDPAGLFTIYAKGVSNDKFSRISIGMTEDDVLSFLPQPLERVVCCEGAPAAYFWRYSKPQKWTYCYRHLYVYFNDEGKVIGTLNEVDAD